MKGDKQDIRLDYASPQQRQRCPFAIWSQLNLITTALGAWAVLVGVMCYLVPRFAAILAGYQAKLPMSTKVVLAASSFLIRGGWFTTLAIAIAICAVGILMNMKCETLRPVRVYCMAVSILLTIFVTVVVILVFAALYSPLMESL